MTKPFAFLAARPAVCVSDLSFLKNPSLSASRIATNETSGRSRPSLSRFTPTRTSKSPNRKSRNISTRSIVSTSEWIYLQRILNFSKYLLNSSAIRFVSVVTNTRSPTFTRSATSSIRSSIWLRLGRTSMGGSNKPVGLTICSTMTPPVCSNS